MSKKVIRTDSGRFIMTESFRFPVEFCDMLTEYSEYYGIPKVEFVMSCVVKYVMERDGGNPDLSLCELSSGCSSIARDNAANRDAREYWLDAMGFYERMRVSLMRMSILDSLERELQDKRIDERNKNTP